MTYYVRYTETGEDDKECCNPSYRDKRTAINDATAFCKQKRGRWVIVFDAATGKQVWARRND